MKTAQHEGENQKASTPKDQKVISNDYNQNQLKFEEKIEPKAPRKGDKKALENSNDTQKQK